MSFLLEEKMHVLKYLHGGMVEGQVLSKGKKFRYKNLEGRENCAVGGSLSKYIMPWHLGLIHSV
jgi:hypothetical protein